MNFIGHAIVALFRDSDPHWVLGSMLPDFAGMCRHRLRGAREPTVDAGITLDLRTDEIFHRNAYFTRWTTSGSQTLIAAGVGRGPAGAVAHVGAELLLDGLLLDRDPRLADAYGEALHLELDPLGLELHGERTERLSHLLDRLASQGLPYDYCDPEGVLARLERALSSRPLLALQAVDRKPVLDWLYAIRPRIESDAERLLDELRANLQTDAPTTQ